MPWLMTAISFYLTYYTFIYARLVWKGGNKMAGLGVLLLAASFPGLSLYLSLR